MAGKIASDLFEARGPGADPRDSSTPLQLSLSVRLGAPPRLGRGEENHMARKNTKTTKQSKKTTTQRTKKSDASLGKSGRKDTMPPALQKEFSRLARLIASADRSDAMKRFEIALIVQRIKNGGAKYGDKPLEKLEGKFGFDRTTMYRWATVVDVWSTRKALKELLSKTMASGLPLTWSHVELLAEVDGRSRDRFLERTLKESLSVRKLRDAIGATEAGADAAPDAKPEEGPTPTAKFERLVTSLDHAADTASDWKESVRALAGQPASQVIASLEHASEVGKRIKDLGAEMQVMVEVELKRLRSLGQTVVPLAQPIQSTQAVVVAR